MRKQLPGLPPDVTPKQPVDVITQVREYELITPLYGGGVIPAEADPVTIIRATEIRGHLRFWWRACKGGKFDNNPAKMKEEEDAIWGKAYKKGDAPILQEHTIQITVDVDESKRGESVKLYTVERRRPRPANNIPLYAAIPLPQDQGNSQERADIPYVQKDVSFTMTITFPSKHHNDIEAALWAWETFGGIGARTRRGFGALILSKIDGMNYTKYPASSNVQEWINKKLADPDFVAPGVPPAHVPCLNKKVQLVVILSGEVMWVWNALINKLRFFRQYKKPGENRSGWPEGDAIRAILNGSDELDEELSYSQTFPRAAFGLPIIFHFTGDNAPKDTMLREKGVKKDRFSSPLILRPFLCSDNRAVGLALLLENSRVDAKNLLLVEQNKNKKTHSVKATLSEDEVKKIDVLNGEADVLQAFMNSLKGVR
jgi:CRISPR-associated protein Cmr1